MLRAARARFALALRWARSHRKTASAIAAVALAVPTVYARWLPVLPALTVSVVQTGSANLLPVAFRIKNEGWLPARNLVATCALNRIEAGGGTIRGGLLRGAFFSTPKLSYGKTQTVDCRISSDVAPTVADIAFVVQYDSVFQRPFECTRYVVMAGDWREESCADVLDELRRSLDKS